MKCERKMEKAVRVKGCRGWISMIKVNGEEKEKGRDGIKESWTEFLYLFENTDIKTKL